MPERQITASDLNRLIGTPDAPAIVDVCIDDDFAADPRLIPGAFRWPFTDIDALAPRLARRPTVVVCQKGLKLSQGAAACLRAAGVDATWLAGGMVGWAEAGLPAIRADALPSDRIAAPDDPSLAETACLWLMVRFAAPAARILMVERDQLAAVADRFGADQTPDEPAALAARMGLASPKLEATFAALSGVEAPGLAAVHTGAATMESKFMIFDALYANEENLRRRPS